MVLKFVGKKVLQISRKLCWYFKSFILKAKESFILIRMTIMTIIRREREREKKNGKEKEKEISVDEDVDTLGPL